jgi:hypothetical protein
VQLNCWQNKRQTHRVGDTRQAVVEHAGQAREEFVAENEVHVFCKRDGVGDDGGKNVGGAEEIKKVGGGEGGFRR